MANKSKWRSRAMQERVLAIGSPVLLLVVWEALVWAKVVDARYVPAPSTIFETAWQMTLSGELWEHVRASLWRLAAGFLIGVVPGIAIGLIMGLNRYVRAALDPLVSATYPIPKVAILPLLMLAFGIGDGSKIAVIATAVVYLALINTMLGVMTLDRVYFEVARNYGAPWRKLFTRVIIPGALPHIFAGLRLSLGVSLIVIVSAEFVAG
jgi:ABC-type nitrate/sulfonate/bicarbonate transport system permease component